MQVFDSGSRTVPTQLLLSFGSADMCAPDPRWFELPPPPLQQAFPIGGEVVYVGRSPTVPYGSIGIVTAHHRTRRVTRLSVKFRVYPVASSFGRRLAKLAELRFYPSFLVSQQLLLDARVLGRVCSSVRLNPGKVDVGLRLRFPKLRLQVGRCCRVARRGVPSRTETR